MGIRNQPIHTTLFDVSYKPKVFFSNAKHNGVPPSRPMFYVAGPPCQPFSSAGKNKSWEDPRASLYFTTIHNIVRTQPIIAIIENSPNIINDDKGRSFNRAKGMLQEAGYVVTTYTTNTLKHGLPHNRHRTFLIAIAKDHLKKPWAPPVDLPYGEKHNITLEKILIPYNQQVDSPNILPKAAHQRRVVEQAKDKTDEDTGDWMVAEHCSFKCQPNPRPLPHTPAMTAQKRKSHWIGSRGRRALTTEAARLQGFSPHMIRWNHREPENHYMLGNTISVPVLHRILINSIQATGFSIDDPWELGTAQPHLIQSAKTDTMPHNFRITRTVKIGSLIQKHKHTNKPKQPKQVTLLRYYQPRSKQSEPNKTPDPSNQKPDHDQIPPPPCYSDQRFAKTSIWGDEPKPTDQDPQTENTGINNTDATPPPHYR